MPTLWGMRVVAVRENPNKPKPEGVETVFPSSELDSLISQSDYIALTVPVTPETRTLMRCPVCPDETGTTSYQCRTRAARG